MGRAPSKPHMYIYMYIYNKLKNFIIEIKNLLNPNQIKTYEPNMIFSIFFNNKFYGIGLIIGVLY
jgi:hypothetical protein